MFLVRYYDGSYFSGNGNSILVISIALLCLPLLFSFDVVYLFDTLLDRVFSSPLLIRTSQCNSLRLPHNSLPSAADLGLVLLLILSPLHGRTIFVFSRSMFSSSVTTIMSSAYTAIAGCSIEAESLLKTQVASIIVLMTWWTMLRVSGTDDIFVFNLWFSLTLGWAYFNNSINKDCGTPLRLSIITIISWLTVLKAFWRSAAAMYTFVPFLHFSFNILLVVPMWSSADLFLAIAAWNRSVCCRYFSSSLEENKRNTCILHCIARFFGNRQHF